MSHNQLEKEENAEWHVHNNHSPMDIGRVTEINDVETFEHRWQNTKMNLTTHHIS